MIEFDQKICGDLQAALAHEWLETNGLGGFASSTIVGLNTRRYHALLVAATQPPGGRLVLLSKMEETLVIDGRRFDLSANRYPGAVHPEGFRYLKRFRLDPFPVFTYEVEGFQIEKSVFMVQGENSTIVEYEVGWNRASWARRIEFILRPLIAFRDYHDMTHQNDTINSALRSEPGLASLSLYPGLPSLHLAHNAVEILNAGVWYRNFEYDAERERGLDFREDLFNPCALRFDLNQGSRVEVIASTEVREVVRVPEYRQAAIARRRTLVAASPIADDFAQTLSEASDHYIVARGECNSVIAGYHWFGEWGRDTMISLPGLTLLTGRFEIARGILRTSAQHVDQGMLPNRFPDAGGQPEYNTADATLWFFEAARAYLAYTGDFEFVRKELYSVFNDIINWHLRGTRYGIKIDAAGLLNCGDEGFQLTWMDAKVGDWVVTPRRGQPVEIQALWYNALRIMEELARTFGDEGGQKRYATLAALVLWSFNRLFWNEKGGCLYDVVNGSSPDASIRPNQIFAVSLHHSMLPVEKAKSVVARVQEHLLTPYGLRSLSPGDPQYRGHYSGDQLSRDGAYHQGTVWSWLMGPFLTAYLKVNGDTVAARDQAAAWLTNLREHLSQAGLGHVSEIFCGDTPHRSVGCIAQAWSAAELLRTYVEDVHAIRPKGQTDSAPGENGSVPSAFVTGAAGRSPAVLTRSAPPPAFDAGEISFRPERSGIPRRNL